MTMSKYNHDEPWEDDVSVNTSSHTPASSSKVDESFSYEIAQLESKQVFKQKVLVILVLFLAAVSVSLAVFFITTNAESDQFVQHFQGGADKIVASFESILQEKIGSIGSLCLAFTAHGLARQEIDHPNSSDTVWPFVTIDSFHESAASARILSNVLHMSVLPIVTKDKRQAWEAYSVENGEWYAEGFAYQMALLESGFSLQGATMSSDKDNRALLGAYMEAALATPFRERDPRRRLSNSTEGADQEGEEEEFTLFVPFIYEYAPDWSLAPANTSLFTPVWQSAPVTALDGINLNVYSFPNGKERLDIVMEKGEFAMGGFITAEPGNSSSADYNTAWFSELLSTQAGKPVDYNGDPLIDGTYPIFSDFTEDRQVVAAMNFQFSWQTYFQGILPDNANGFTMVLKNGCDGAYTYEIDGSQVNMLGIGDLHDSKFDDYQVSTYLEDGLVIQDGSREGVKINQRGCPYSLHVYPSQEMYDAYNTNTPLVITICILFIFIFTAGMFYLYDHLVQKRNDLVVSTAKESTQIVQSLFPTMDPSEFLSPNQRVKSYLSGGGLRDGEAMKPIADLFPHTTVMFGDITGFTAWSSTRDPSQVFTLLQTIYGEFDAIAKRRKVFKVETIGDCYVAVAGLPSPQSAHAVIMARFAGECQRNFVVLVRKLEVTLGPDTAELGMRFGLHSGAVTAGVLRGERARFQLFGDTVNTAARMESTGKRNMIQVSHSTADLLVAASKGHWLESREDSVMAKGKGVLNTFWVFPHRQEMDMSRSQSVEFSIENLDEMPSVDRKALQKAAKVERLVDWMTDVLLKRLREIVVRRKTQPGTTLHKSQNAITYKPDHCPLQEVVEAIELPDFDYNAVSFDAAETVEIPAVVSTRLREHVAAIASKYNDNPFHSFEHACHVTMSVSKLLGRVQTPDMDINELKGEDAHRLAMSHIHHYTHGICSDPLTIFAIVYSALIHDLDHQGVSNTQLMKEDAVMARMYQEKSVAEQHSLDLAWDLLMEDSMAELRSYLFGNDKQEVLRFRQVVVNIVLATDIFDKELNDLRKLRWTKAFSESATTGGSNHLRATIVLEHIMQASDVSHTMQHWHIYQKWNRRLFLELHSAYRQGRMGADPAKFWYQGEIGFFDNYVIPLAKKLKECGVFGVSSDECLTYALQNRAEWEARGQEIVQGLIEEVEGLVDDCTKPPLTPVPLTSRSTDVEV